MELKKINAKPDGIASIMVYIQIIWSTMKLQMKQSFARPMFRFCLICNPIVNTIFLYEMFLNKGIDEFLNYVVLGAGLMGIWGCICFSSVGDINRERWSGTLPLLYVAPGGFGLIIFGKVLGNTVISMLTFVLSYLTAGILSGQWPVITHVGWFALSMVLTVMCFIVVSLCFAYIMMLSRKTELYMNLIEIPLVFICGFTFPIEVLPGWVQAISNLLAPTWAVRLLRMSCQASSGSGLGYIDFEMGISDAVYHGTKQMNYVLYGQYVGILLIEMAVFILFTIGLYRWMDKRVRISATLEVS